MHASWEDFQKLDIRVGRIVSVEDFPDVRIYAYRITVDFGGTVGTRRSFAAATNYEKVELLEKQVLCVMNFPPERIANTVSEVLILGVRTSNRGTALLVPDFEAIDGAPISEYHDGKMPLRKRAGL